VEISQPSDATARHTSHFHPAKRTIKILAIALDAALHDTTWKRSTNDRAISRWICHGVSPIGFLFLMRHAPTRHSLTARTTVLKPFSVFRFCRTVKANQSIGSSTFAQNLHRSKRWPSDNRRPHPNEAKTFTLLST